MALVASGGQRRRTSGSGGTAEVRLQKVIFNCLTIQHVQGRDVRMPDNFLSN